MGTVLSLAPWATSSPTIASLGYPEKPESLSHLFIKPTGRFLQVWSEVGQLQFLLSGAFEAAGYEEGARFGLREGKGRL